MKTRKEALRELLDKKKKELGVLHNPTAEVQDKVGWKFPPDPPSAGVLQSLGIRPGDFFLEGNPGASHLSHGGAAPVFPGLLGEVAAADIGPQEGEPSLLGLASKVLRLLPRLQPAVSASRQDSTMDGLLPLPLPQDLKGPGIRHFEAWVRGVVLCLNWMTGNGFNLGPDPPTSKQTRVLDEILRSLGVLDTWVGVDIGECDPQEMFRQRWVNSYGEEVHIAQKLRWENISDSLPKEGLSGIVPAVDICEGGVQDFLNNPDRWVKSPENQVWMKPPRIMIDKEDWPQVAQGLIDRGICGVMPLSSAFEVKGGKILGGLFGVPKNESTDSGVPILRLIMDFRPINENFLNLGGDLTTLPVLSQMFQLEIRPHEDILISSEDIRAMFYIIGLPPVWNKFLGFGRILPKYMNPPGSEGDHILYSRVLPMGFVNSVAVAQHLHRRLVIRALNGSISAGQEIRRDREFPLATLFFRVYLDNFDVLSIRSKTLLESDEPSLTALLRSTYEQLHVPRNEKKAVLAESAAEIQGAWLDGSRGICRAKGAKLGKYLVAVSYLLEKGRATRKEMQMVAGGLVYIFSFRRPLMSLLNEIWHFITSFKTDHQVRPIPPVVLEELFCSFFLSSLSFMNFRLESSPIVTCSDASEQGGGLCASSGLTHWGVKASQGTVRGERFEGFQEMGLLVISLFDGVGALRLSLDALDVPLAGYVSVEKDPCARRVLESFYPSCSFIEMVESITLETVRGWAVQYPNCLGILIAGGPPINGRVSLLGSNWGDQQEPNLESLHRFKEVWKFCKQVFSWCPCYFLLESLVSISPEMRAVFTRTTGVLPYKVDARYLALCKRPRLWWFNWSIPSTECTEIFPPQNNQPDQIGEIRFHHEVSSKNFLRTGWKTQQGFTKFAAFTTAQPSRSRRAPAGLESATAADLEKWERDRCRFPPYSYSRVNGVHHPKKGWRMLSVQEKELIMGWPFNFTEQCKGKAFRSGQPNETDDIRMSLIGNGWHAGVVCCLVHPLCQKLGLTSPKTVPEILQGLHPGGSTALGSILLKEGHERPLPFETISVSPDAPQMLVTKICHLVSCKGSDVLLTSNTEPIPKFHRLRNSLSPKLWKWKELCGWKWKAHQSGCTEHINKLELGAVQTALRWRLCKQRETNRRVLHLVDSLVSLQVLNKGRSSSYKLRATCKRIAALQLLGNFMLVLAYTNTKTNPADRPSRAPRKRKWASVK